MMSMIAEAPDKVNRQLAELEPSEDKPETEAGHGFDPALWSL